MLNALDYIHSLHLIHCDLKPENILISSVSGSEVKIIDFGSSCFIHDHLSSYVQSRSYRAPEVIIVIFKTYSKLISRAVNTITRSISGVWVAF
jgi:serine/threonine protein kinase